MSKSNRRIELTGSQSLERETKHEFHYAKKDRRKARAIIDAKKVKGGKKTASLSHNVFKPARGKEKEAQLQARIEMVVAAAQKKDAPACSDPLHEDFSHRLSMHQPRGAFKLG